jgi:hypothetical protein
MPGIGDEIEGAMQHAPHPERHSIVVNPLLSRPQTTNPEGHD